MARVSSGEVTTSDGVILRFLEAGSGAPLLIVPGLACTAQGFDAQLDGLSENNPVIALDMRGHGLSDKPRHGYRVARLAADLRDVLETLDLEDVTLMGHSLGCGVIWSFFDMFDTNRIKRLVFVDMRPMVTRNPAWSNEENRIAGGRFSPDETMAFANRLAADPERTLQRFFGAMLTDTCPNDRRKQLLDEATTLPGEHAAKLGFDLGMTDLRDVLPRIDKPSLYIGGEHNTVSLDSQRWICEQIPDVQHVVFGPKHLNHERPIQRCGRDSGEGLLDDGSGAGNVDAYVAVGISDELVAPFEEHARPLGEVPSEIDVG